MTDPTTRWDALKAHGLRDIADWGGPCPYQFSAWIEPEEKYLYFRVRGGIASMDVMPTYDPPSRTEWEGMERYDESVTWDAEPEVTLPLFEKLIRGWRAGRPPEF